jgi:tryptophanyl-tRNA synthetase
MSKSTGGPGVLWLLDEPAVNAKKIRSAVTDTEREIRFDPEDKPGVSNLLTIMSALSGDSIETLEKRFVGSGYGDLKAAVADTFASFAGPFRERALGYLENPASLDETLAAGAAKASELAGPTLAHVFDRVGFLPATR